MLDLLPEDGTTYKFKVLVTNRHAFWAYELQQSASSMRVAGLTYCERWARIGNDTNPRNYRRDTRTRWRGGAPNCTLDSHEPPTERISTYLQPDFKKQMRSNELTLLPNNSC